MLRIEADAYAGANLDMLALRQTKGFTQIGNDCSSTTNRKFVTLYSNILLL